jgi:L-asparaginase
MKPKVKILYTGGTLGMSADTGGELVPDEALADLLRWVPELNEVARIEVEMVSNIDSSLIEPDLWLVLARRIRETQDEGSARGLVILHGTDTLAFTASMLSFLLPDLQIPVVLTGSQKPLQIARTDARNNVIGAVESCVHGPVEVMVFFRDYAFRGNRCTKVAISDFRAFDSPNFPPLGKAGIRWDWQTNRFWPGSRRPSIWPDLPSEFPSTPWVIPWVPGFELTVVNASLEGQWAIVIEAFGSGNMPLSPETALCLRKFMERGGIVAVRSQVPGGGVDLELYAPGLELMKIGVVDAGDMTREALVTKLMALKAQGMDGNALRHALNRSMVGELSRGD